MEQGRSNFARLLKQLLSRNRLSHSDFKTLHDWCNPATKSWLSTSQISGLRTGKLKAPGPRCFDSISDANLALARIASGDTKSLPPLPSSLKHLSEEAWFSSVPETGKPMDAGDLFMVWLGRLDPLVDEETFSDRQAKELCERIARAFQGWLLKGSILPIDARAMIEDRLMDLPKGLREKVWLTLIGGAALKGEELEEARSVMQEILGQALEARPLSQEEWRSWVLG